MTYSLSELERVYRLQYLKIKRVIAHMNLDPAQAEELTQDAFLKAWQKRSDYRESGNLVNWIYRIAINLSINQLRRKKFEFSLEPSRLEAILKTKEEDNPYQRAAALENSSLIQKALQKIPSPFRQVICLCDLQDYTYSEAAQTLNLPQGTVMSRLYRGRRKLKKELAPFFQ